MSSLQKRAEELHKHVPPDWYESSVKTNLLQRFWHKRREDEIRKWASPVSGTVLDIGCADGYFSNIILQATRAKRIIGIDVLRASIQYAKIRYKSDKRLSFAVADAHKLPYKTNMFSAVFSIESLEHVLHPDVALAEMRRVVKKNGYVFILIPTENRLFRFIWFFWTKSKGKVWNDSHVHIFQPADLPALVKKAGFRKISSHYFLSDMLLLVKAHK